MPINPNSAYARFTFDVPTELAIQFDGLARQAGKAKGVIFRELVQQYVQAQAPQSGEVPTPAAPAKKRSRRG